MMLVSIKYFEVVVKSLIILILLNVVMMELVGKIIMFDYGVLFWIDIKKMIFRNIVAIVKIVNFINYYGCDFIFIFFRGN